MNAITKTNPTLDPAIIESLVLNGDVGKLTPGQKLQYVAYRCKQVGLDPAAQPFQLLRLQGKEVLYATAGATQQLCQSRGLSVAVTSREKIEDIYCVTARVTGPDNRVTENMGTVSIGGLKGEALANAMLKTVTKAIRRSVLAHCGLGMLDETEVETIPGAQTIQTGRRGNPLRQDYQTWGLEIDAAKSQEQIDLALGSPEFAEFEKAATEQETRTGVNYAAIIRDQADKRRKALPARIVRDEHDHNQRGFERPETETFNPMTEQDAAQSSAVVAPAAPPQGAEAVRSPPEPSPTEEILPEYSKEMNELFSMIDLAETQDDLTEASLAIAKHNLSETDKNALRNAYRVRAATLRKMRDAA